MRRMICNGVAIYSGAIKNPKDVIDIVESVLANELNTNFAWEKSTVVHSDGLISTSDVRTNSILSLAVAGSDIHSSALKYVNNLLHESFTECLCDFLVKFNINVNPRTSTNYSILKYSKTEKYIHHLDHGENTPRKVSAVGYLNDDFLGGELDFDKLGFNYSPVAGDIVVFPSVKPYSHASMPIQDGVKYSVVNWWS